jgi:hypothetical protein
MTITIGGSIQSVSIKGRIFAVAADADASRKLGGSENEVQPNGDGSARKVMKRVPWILSGLTLDINEDREDQQFLKAVAEALEWVAITATFASGVTYQGIGTVSDELTVSSETATAEVTLSGPGELTQQ